MSKEKIVLAGDRLTIDQIEQVESSNDNVQIKLGVGLMFTEEGVISLQSGVFHQTFSPKPQFWLESSQKRVRNNMTK
jgi:hypothetical protein